MKQTKRILAAILCVAMIMITLDTNNFNAVSGKTDTELMESQTESINEEPPVVEENNTEKNEATESATLEQETETSSSEEPSATEETEITEETGTEENTDETSTETETTTEEDVAVSDDSLNKAIPEGYHQYIDGKIYGNMYIFRYDPNNGDDEYEKENQGYEYPNDIYSKHYYDHVDMYDGLPVYSIHTDPALIRGERDIDYYLDDYTLTRNVFDRDNYDFVEWNTLPDGSGKTYKNEASIYNEYSEDMYEQTLYAQWEISETEFTILKNSGTFPMDDFFSINGINKDDYMVETSEDGERRIYTLDNGSKLSIMETESKVEFKADCLTSVKIPDMISPDPAEAFVGYETSSNNWNAENSTYLFENKNNKPALKALFLSALTLEGVIDMTGYNGKACVSLTWGTAVDDDIEKVYKIAQSLDGVNFEYIPDQNLTDLIEGKVYDYTGSVQTFTAPISGQYYIESYGANGGIGYVYEQDGSRKGGYGGKTSGYVDLKKGQTIYLYVGEAGKTYASNGTSRTYGGGGASPVKSKVWSDGQSSENWKLHVQGRGGGATYVSLTEKELSDYIPEGYTSLSSSELKNRENSAVSQAKEHVLMVAAGGSGCGDGNSGADGGGLSGPNVVNTNYHYGTVNKWTATGATQNSAGYGDFGTLNGMSDDYTYRTTTYGTFFYGANGMTCSGAAGGGWFGGGMCYYVGGSGASSYLGTQAGLYDAKTETGGNKANAKDARREYDVNGKVIIRIMEYWITTNTSEKIYSPDVAAPDVPENLNVNLSEDQTGTVSWGNSDDNGTDYWYRVDAFDATNYSNKIAETEVKQFNILSGLDGYYYIIDNAEDTQAHQGNGTFTQDTSVSGVDILDVGKPVYLHVSAVDKAGNLSDTAHLLLNKTTVVVDPNAKGTYNSSKSVQSFILNSGEVYTISNIVADNGQEFLEWKKTTGDGVLDQAQKTITTGYSKTTIVAQYMAELVLEAKPNYMANSKKGAIDLSWLQDDTLLKKYRLYISSDGTSWEEAATPATGSSDTVSYSYNASTGYYSYVIPRSGSYTLTANGAKGGDYQSYTGGNGSSVQGTFELKKGDTLYIYCGGVGTNGAGNGSPEGAAGGGATDIRLNGTALSNRILVAAGGGGANAGASGNAEQAGQGNNGSIGQGTSGASNVTIPTPVQADTDANADKVSFNVSGGGSGYYGGFAGVKSAELKNRRPSFPTKSGYITVTPANKVATNYIFDLNDERGNGVATINGFAYIYYMPETITVNGEVYFRFYENGSPVIDNKSYPPYVVVSKENTSTMRMYYKDSASYDGGSGPYFYATYDKGGTSEGNAGICKYMHLYYSDPAYTTSSAGTSWLDQNKGVVSYTKFGSNAGNGSAVIAMNEAPVGELTVQTQEGIIALDKAAPNAPYAGKISAKNTSSTTLTWAKPEDNGTLYYNRAESYQQGTERKLRDSNITETVIATGVEKYRWYADNSSSGTVTGTNSNIVEANSLTVSNADLTKYYHVAAVDYAGNIGPTYTFQPSSTVSVAVNVIWEDSSNANGTRPNSGVSVSIYGENKNSAAQTKNLSSYAANESVVFTNLPSTNAAGNVIVYTAKINGVSSQNSKYAYTTSYSADTLTITNKLSKITKDVQVQVNWDDAGNSLDTRPDNFVIKVVDDNGTVIKTITVEKDKTSVTVPDLPENKDYHIIVEGVDSKQPENVYTTEISKNGDSFVIDNKLKYSVTVVPNGGTWNGSTENKTYQEYAGTNIGLPDPVRQGYDFVGWKISEGGDVTIADHTLIVGHANTTITAQWERKKLTLTIDPAGGIHDTSSAIQKYKLEYGGKKIINVPTRTGYIFNKWVLTGNGSYMASLSAKSAFTMGYEDALLTATWKAKEITVTLDPQGGTVNPEKIKVVYESPYGTLPDPVRPGYDFTGWTMDKEGKQEVTEETIVTIPNDHTIYAQWSTKKIGISGKVVWIDEGNKYGSRPDRVNINILADGEFVSWTEKESKEGAVTNADSPDWTFVKDALQEYNLNTGRKIDYSVILSPHPATSLNKHYAYRTEYKKEADGSFTITNTMYLATKNIEGTITWVDKSNAYGSRPEMVVVELYQDGKKVDSAEVKGNGDKWTYSFSDWLIFRDDGSEYDYTVNVNPNPTPSMNKDDAYQTDIKNYDITETLGNNGSKTVEGTITWVDDNNKWHYRPQEVTIELWADGKKLDSIQVPDGTLDFSFDSLPKYDKNLNLIDYVVKEIVNDYYTIEITKTEVPNSSGKTDNHRFDIVNTFTPDENIEVKPSVLADISMRVVYEDESKLPYLGLSKEDLCFTASLVEMKKVFVPAGTPGAFDVAYEDSETGKRIQVILTDQYVSILGIEPGKYRIDVDKDPLFEFVKMLAARTENVKLVQENGNYYLIMDGSKGNISADIDILLRADWNGYTDRAFINNFFKS